MYYRVLGLLGRYSRRVVPVVVCALFLPVLALLSVLAGYTVWSSLSVSWQVPLHLQYGDGRPPYAYVHLPKLMADQHYHVFLHLVLPLTDANLGLGNFMTSLTMATLANKTVAFSRRPTILSSPKPSFFLPKAVDAHIKVPLLESFVASSQSLAATVEIGRKDSWTTLALGHGREVSVISASLRGLAIPHGIRGIAIRFPFLASLAAAFIFFTVLSLVLGLCILPLVLPPGLEDLVKTEDSGKELKRRDSSSSLTDVGGSKRKRRSRSSRSKGSVERIKREDAPETSIPSPAVPESNLRRRSSKMSLED